MSVSEDLLMMAQYGVSYVGSKDTPPSKWLRVSYFFFGIITGLGLAMILGWHP